MGTVQNQDGGSSSKSMAFQVQQHQRQRRKALLRLCSALALSVLLSRGGIGQGRGGFMNVADALPAQGPPQPYYQAALATPFLGETTIKTAGTQERGDTTPCKSSTTLLVLLEHPTSKKHPSKGKDSKDNASRTMALNQNKLPGQDQHHRDFLDLASRVSGKSTHKIDREFQKERKQVQKEHQAHFRLMQQQLKQQEKQIWKQRQQQKLEDKDGESALKEKEGNGGKKDQLGRVHGKDAGRIRLPTDVTRPSKGREKGTKETHGHDADRSRRREMAGDDDGDEYEERDEGEERDGGDAKAANFARHPQRHPKDKKSESKKPLSKENKRSTDDAMEYHFQKRKTTPAIFYVPHQDDDALAMALAIREHLDTGRKVIVHLYSDGINALLRDIVAGAVPCPLGHPPHRFNLTLQDVVTGRTHEFRQSIRALGVEDEDIHETGWSDIEPLKDYAAFQRKLRGLILGYEKKHPGASHKCISGEYDRDSVGRNPTHRACWDVATELLNEHPKGWPESRQLWDFRFYRTYTYYNPAPRRSAQFIRSLPQHLLFKQKALDQYKRWEPKRGELAWGYHSVKPLIDAAYNDSHVYMDMLDNDPTNPSNWYTPRIGGTHGKSMFPDVWKSTHEKDWNQALIQAQAEARNLQQQSKDEEGEEDVGGRDTEQDDEEDENDFAQKEDELLEDSEIQGQDLTPVAKWDKKEEAMRKEILEAFEKAARGPEGGTYYKRVSIS